MSGEYAIYIISAAAFVTIIALFDGLYTYWQGVNLPGKRKVDKRLHELYAGGIDRDEALSLLRKQQLSDNAALDTLYNATPRMVALHRFIEQSGVHVSISGFLLMQFFLSVVVFSIFHLFTQFHIGASIFIGLAIGLYTPYYLIKRKRNQRNDLFREQLPEALDYISRSLRAGNPFSATIKLVSKEMPDPIATEFGITFDELNFGLELNHALHGLFERTQSEEIRYFVTAVLLQRDTGGNLAEVLTRIATIIRARSVTKKEIRILSAEMRQSAHVLLALPFVIAGAVTILNPKYLLPLTQTDAGLMIIGCQMVLMLMGYLIIQKMVNFRV